MVRGDALHFNRMADMNGSEHLWRGAQRSRLESTWMTRLMMEEARLRAIIAKFEQANG
jgi:hypothetical protein